MLDCHKIKCVCNSLWQSCKDWSIAFARDRSSTFGCSLPDSLVAQSGRARGMGLPRRNNSMGGSGATSYFRAQRIVGHQDGHPHLRCAPAAGPRPAANQVPPGPGPAPLALPKTPVLLLSGSTCRLRATLREMSDAARLTPRSSPLAATLIGGLRPGSLRVHAPCKETGHGSRLGFPGRRTPGGPAASGNVARGLHVPLRGKPRERRVREERRICRTPDDRTSANGWRRPGTQPPGGEFRHRCFLPDEINGA